MPTVGQGADIASWKFKCSHLDISLIHPQEIEHRLPPCLNYRSWKTGRNGQNVDMSRCSPWCKVKWAPTHRMSRLRSAWDRGHHSWKEGGVAACTCEVFSEDEILWSWVGKELYNQVGWKHILHRLKVKGEKPRKAPGAQGGVLCYASGRAWRCMPDASECDGCKPLEGSQLSSSYTVTEDWSSFMYGWSASLTQCT